MKKISGRKLLNIANRLLQKKVKQIEPSLSEGLCGLILLLAYLHKRKKSQTTLNLLESSFDKLINHLITRGNNEMFYGGYAGIGWTIAHLQKNGMIQKGEFEPILKKIDQLIYSQLVKNSFAYSTDIHYGLIGFGLYFLERGNTFSKKVIVKIIESIDAQRIKDGKYFTWPDHAGMKIRNAKKYEYSLGYHYGIGGVCSFLMMCYSNNISASKSKGLVISCLKWVSEQSWQVGGAFYPDEVTDSLKSRPSRLTWRSSDIAMAIVFYQAYLLFGNLEFKELSRKIIKQAILRNMGNSGIPSFNGNFNSGLLYGASGTALMLSYYANLTGDSSIMRSAKYWIKQVMDNLESHNYYDPYDSKWKREFGFFNGSCGEILMLLAVSDNQTSPWIRSFLLMP